MKITLLTIVVYLIIPGIIFLIGREMSRNKKENYEKYTKIASKLKVHPMIFKNYLANIIKFSPILYYSFILYSPFNIMMYFAIIVILIGAMVWHIKDVTGKPIDIVLSNFLASVGQMKSNFFMKFTVLMSLSLIITSFIMSGIIKPITEKVTNGAIIEELQENIDIQDNN